MKKTLFALLCSTVLLAGANLNAQTSPAAPAVTTPAATETAERAEVTGTITDVTPDRSLVLHTGTDAGEPVVFRFAPQVTYVDEDGKVVEAAGLRKNLRVRLSYLKSGGDNIIDKVTMLE